MKTKEVTISNIKFNLSTEPLVSEPEVYPDYPSVPPKAYIFSYTISIPVLYPIAKRINPQTKNPYMNQNI